MLTSHARRWALLPAALVLSLVTSGGAFAAQQPDGDQAIGSAQIASALEFLEEHGVDAATRDALGAKLEAGEMWDSYWPERAVSTTTETTTTEIRTTTHFPDGSIAVSTVPNLEGIASATRTGGISPYVVFVGGCTFTSAGSYGGYWKNCRADNNTGVLRIYFYFNYKNIKQDGNVITDYSVGGGHSVGGSLTDWGWQPGGNGKQMKRYATNTLVGGIGSKVVYITVTVSGNTATLSANF
ncbi:MAG: hypothetical protein J0H73_06550 [Salana multivorans]|uniref:hypothetical protein n=1 Tax=Salana multivorans TaxID=120377 RepID=UPI00096839E5|nr:hypothetical protein [Salana multivorans]MBN8881958.1 hypothetical protein [Salana multivorans]OJX97346.1 MAG: hypothetical protein BGO96_05270 [Micrococcales bacterium 73-15]